MFRKVEALEWGPFLQGEQIKKGVMKSTGVAVKSSALSTLMIMSPKIVAAAVTGTGGDAAWMEIFRTAIGIADWLCVAVIIYAGANWMFGNRTKALDLLMGAAFGYLIIRKSLAIQQWLAGL